MLHDISLLQTIEIPKPCPERWEDMQGNARRRRCARCDCQVHDLAMMRENECEKLMRESQRAGQTLCVQVTRWRDGSIITKDSGWRGVVARFLTRWIAPFAAGLPLFLAGCLGGSVAAGRRGDSQQQLQPKTQSSDATPNPCQ